MRREEYLGTWFGRLQVRVLGLMLASAVICVVLDFFRVLAIPTAGKTPGLVIALASSLGALWIGARMLTRPKWWREKYMASITSETGAAQRLLERTLQILGAGVIVLALYFIWHYTNALRI
jgi:hypothetical protein